MSSQDPSSTAQSCMDEPQVLSQLSQVFCPIARNHIIWPAGALFARAAEIVCVGIVLHVVHVLVDHALDRRVELGLHVRLKEPLQVLFRRVGAKERGAIGILFFKVFGDRKAVCQTLTVFEDERGHSWSTDVWAMRGRSWILSQHFFFERERYLAKITLGIMALAYHVVGIVVGISRNVKGSDS